MHRFSRPSGPRRLLVSLSALALAGGFAGCASDGDPGPRPVQRDGLGFISDSPDASGGDDDDDALDAPEAGDGDGDGGGEAERLIAEADIVQVRGDQLFALSRFAGLSVVDLRDPAKLRLVGRYEMTGVPFEMYLEGTVVYAMFSSFGHYDVDEKGDAAWVQSGHVAAIDASDPANLRLAGEFDLPGELSDSRIVGDVLYAVTYESDYCWRCAEGSNTTVTSLAIGDLANVRVVDQLRYESAPGEYGWGRRSVTVTPQRMYVGGVEYGGGLDGAHSTIQVVDISDPGGKLVPGATVEAAGQIESRWQMDEHEGVLRVVSQPGAWATGEPPMLQTFRVESSQALVPLASKPMVLPRPERLRSVRFDGTRGFAITFEQTDPLFALDFSDPADPKQLGELEIPGWVYHMEVRGDRIYALGFDQTNPAGALNVSLFDVADMAAPKMLQRVHFGGDWGNFAEDQDRVHKAFTILPEQGLMLVPFSGWGGGDRCGRGAYQSGIQLVDFTADDLVLRGVAPQRGEARRAFVHNGSLIAVSDQGVRTFSLADRNQPAQVGDLELARNVSRTVLAGDKLVRIGVDWWTGESRLEIASAADPEGAALGALDLAALLPPDEVSCFGVFAYGAHAFANGDLLYLTWSGYDDRAGPGREVQHVAVVSIADPARPAPLGHAALPMGRAFDGYGYGYGYGRGALVPSGASIVAVGTTLVFQVVEGADDDDDDDGDDDETAKLRLNLVDLSNPAAPRLAGGLDWAEGSHFTGLVARGTTVYASHAEPVAGRPGKVRFYVDVADVSNPDAPAALAPVSTPGSLLNIADGRLVTVDYARDTIAATDSTDCQANGHDFTYYDWSSDQCVRVERTFRLLDDQGGWAALRGGVAFPTSGYVTGVFVGDDRIFATTAVYHDYGDEQVDGVTRAAPRSEAGIFVLGGIREGALRGTYTPVASPNPWWASLHGQAATGQRLVVTDYSSEPHVAVFDATDLDAPSFAERAKLRGYLSGVEIVGDAAICSLGQYGVQRVSLAP
ncbi:MAG TPA: beta-propeller domain-containing protein [Polyangiaceae bacterium]|nr:beta-propeller domain-containing protein [Polyangiaceae bacterium]